MLDPVVNPTVDRTSTVLDPVVNPTVDRTSLC